MLPPQKKRRLPQIDSQQIAMTAMIDISLLLLIAFMCAMDTVDLSGTIALPRSHYGEPTVRSGRLVLDVLAKNDERGILDGEIHWSGKRLSDAELTKVLREHAAAGKRDERGYSNLTVLIRADRRLKYRSVKRLEEICRANFIYRLAYGVLPSDGAE